jgi:hypothetical protein
MMNKNGLLMFFFPKLLSFIAFYALNKLQGESYYDLRYFYSQERVEKCFTSKAQSQTWTFKGN